MGYPQLAETGYAALDACIMSPGRAEAQVFAKVTRRMEQVLGDPSSSASARVSVLHDNRRLWQAAAISCADDANAMSETMRAGFINLAGFVDRHTSAVMRDQGKPQILFEINRRVAAGLSSGAS